MNLSHLLAESLERDRQRTIEMLPAVRRAACYRACCAPDLLDRVARLLGRNDCQEGSR